MKAAICFAVIGIALALVPTSNTAGRILQQSPTKDDEIKPDPNLPVIPDQFYSTIVGNTTSTVSGVPSGSVVIKQWYDYKNRRLRKDFDNGVTKMYDYKTLVDSGIAPHPRFPSPQGFKFRTDDIAGTCCWLWLIDNTTEPGAETPETMDALEVEKNAKDVGADAKGEHWSSVKKFPFLQTDDWWFNKTDGRLSASNTYVKIPKEGTIMSNGTFQDVQYGPESVPASVFAHPDSRPEFGKCKQCGVDDECPMWECMQ
jgi:hypothetical protein